MCNICKAHTQTKVLVLSGVHDIVFVCVCTRLSISDNILFLRTIVFKHTHIVYKSFWKKVCVTECVTERDLYLFLCPLP